MLLFEEKKREDRLRAVTGYGMFWLVWSDLGSGAETAARFRRQIRQMAA